MRTHGAHTWVDHALASGDFKRWVVIHFYKVAWLALARLGHAPPAEGSSISLKINHPAQSMRQAEWCGANVLLPAMS